ncbi:hypothetical protein AGOR_G00130070 [Albula goreensis]|uniref:VPS9 domain-containing protein n=1 Tax=Albula goreensis TaxID=1534307 RepID=A0A8T3DEX5_9TELE|nr:hypothetical protein AGOR_G00130070 [Albula goreensis]
MSHPGQTHDHMTTSSGITMCSIQVTSANGALCIINPLYLHEHGDNWLTPPLRPQSSVSRTSQLANRKRERRLSTTRQWEGAGLHRMRGLSLDQEPHDTPPGDPECASAPPPGPSPAPPSAPEAVVLRRASQSAGCSSPRGLGEGAPGMTAGSSGENTPTPLSPHRVSWIENGVWLSPPPPHTLLHPPCMELDSLSISSLEEEPDPSLSPAHHHAHRLPLVLADKVKNRLSAVGQALGGLVSPQKRLSNRVQELSERRGGAFAEALRAFLEHTMMSDTHTHPTGTELLQEVRNTLTNLREALFDCAEIQTLMESLGDVADWELDAMVEVCLHRVALKPLRTHLYTCLREFRCRDSTLQQLRENLQALEGRGPQDLGGTAAGAGVPDAVALERIQQRWAAMHQAYSPNKKVQIMLKVCKSIYHSMSANASPGAVFGADDFLPCLTWVLLRSDLSTLQLDTDYMMELLDPAQLQGEGGYYLTSVYASLFYISSFRPRLATRQLSVEAQQSLSQWHRRRTLHCNQSRRCKSRQTIRRHAQGVRVGPHSKAGLTEGEGVTDCHRGGRTATPSGGRPENALCPTQGELGVLREERGHLAAQGTGGGVRLEEPEVCPFEDGQEGQWSARGSRGLPRTAGEDTSKRVEESGRPREAGLGGDSLRKSWGKEGEHQAGNHGEASEDDAL